MKWLSLKAFGAWPGLSTPVERRVPDELDLHRQKDAACRVLGYLPSGVGPSLGDEGGDPAAALEDKLEKAYGKVQDIANRAVDAARREVITVPIRTPTRAVRSELAVERRGGLSFLSLTRQGILCLERGGEEGAEGLRRGG